MDEKEIIQKVARSLAESFAETFTGEQYSTAEEFFLGAPTIYRLRWHSSLDAFGIAQIAADVTAQLVQLREKKKLKFYKILPPDSASVIFAMIQNPPALVVHQWNSNTLTDELAIRFDVERQ
jgi:hypothetical protein